LIKVLFGHISHIWKLSCYAENVQSNNIFIKRTSRRIDIFFLVLARGKTQDFLCRCLFWSKLTSCFSAFFFSTISALWLDDVREHRISSWVFFPFSHLFFFFHEHPRISIFLSRATLLPMHSIRESCIVYIRVYSCRTWTCIPRMPLYGFHTGTSFNFPNETRFSFRGWHVESSDDESYTGGIKNT